MRGKPKSDLFPGVEIRRLNKDDLDECASLCTKVHGFDRLNELQEGLKTLSPLGVLREGHVKAYALAIHMWSRNHAVAASGHCDRCFD